MTVNPVGGSGADEGRDGWCTPRWLANVIGEVGLDPCSNAGSHIQAMWKVRQDFGGDGLGGTLRGEFLWGTTIGPVLRQKATADWVVFINPPYARGAVIRWIRHYVHTDFRFLLRWAPDTVWFAMLWPKCWGAWFPKKCRANPSGRINFEPPPGVTASSNPFPHALYLRSEPTGEFLDRLLATGYLVRNDGHRFATGVGREGEEAARGVAAGGAGAGEGGSRETVRGHRADFYVVDECKDYVEVVEQWHLPTTRDAAGGEVPGEER